MEYYWWFAIALGFFAVEIITPGFVLMWFGVGAIIAGLLDLLGIHNMFVQVIVFGISSIVLVALSRTIFKNVFMRRSPGAGLRTNMDAMIGRTGKVSEDIDNTMSAGRVIIDGQDWLARSDGGQSIPSGTRVSVVRFEGARLIVAPLA
jgi:membrane protein implicated in regulation of membrane protease activity